MFRGPDPLEDQMTVRLDLLPPVRISRDQNGAFRCLKSERRVRGTLMMPDLLESVRVYTWWSRVVCILQAEESCISESLNLFTDRFVEASMSCFIFSSHHCHIGLHCCPLTTGGRHPPHKLNL